MAKITKKLTDKATRHGLKIEFDGSAASYFVTNVESGDTVSSHDTSPEAALNAALEKMVPDGGKKPRTRATSRRKPKAESDGTDDKPKSKLAQAMENRRSSYEDDNCGDEIAVELAEALTLLQRGGKEGAKPKTIMDEAKYQKICEDNGIESTKWDHLNPGHRRMNLGNVLRGKYRRGEPVLIMGRRMVNPSPTVTRGRSKEHNDGIRAAQTQKKAQKAKAKADTDKVRARAKKAPDAKRPRKAPAKKAA